MQVGIPQITRYFIDTAQAGGTDEALLAAAAVFIGLALLQQAVAIIVESFLKSELAPEPLDPSRLDAAQ